MEVAKQIYNTSKISSEVIGLMKQQQKIEADELQQQGIEQAQNRNLPTAIELWQQALVIYQQLNDLQGQGNTLGNLGLAYHFLGDYQQALAHHQQSLALEEEVNSFSDAGESQNSHEIIDRMKTI